MSKKKTPHRLRIRKGDQVVVISGEDKTKEGRVLAVYPKTNRVLVEGINVVRRAYGRRTPVGMQQPGFHDKELPISISNVALIDPATGDPTRVGVRVETDAEGKRHTIRVAKASGTDITE